VADVTRIPTHGYDTVLRSMLKVVPLLSRMLAVCFALEMVDVPACPDEWQAHRAAETVTLAAPLTIDFSTVSSLAPPSAAPMDQDCGCPCHQTFGRESVPSIPPPAARGERFSNLSFSSPPPPPVDLFRPPQNLV